MNVLELFAGIGGLALGLERAGMRAVGFVEIDPYCRRVLAKHWPEVPRHDDVRTCAQWWEGEPRPRVDVVAGGYPCQPDSLAGKRLGTADARWLWPDMARVIHALRPRYVIGENVMGHRTRGLRFVLRDLERLGYTARAGIVGAGEMGAPHRRQRIFVLADTEREPREAWRTGDAGQGARARDADRGGVGTDVADAGREGRNPGLGERPGGIQGDEGPHERDDASRHGWWAAEPDVGRVAHGVPGRVDRLGALGNAVVPQVGEYVGRLLISGAWRDD